VYKKERCLFGWISIFYFSGESVEAKFATAESCELTACEEFGIFAKL
jgi:hypothetical protein